MQIFFISIVVACAAIILFIYLIKVRPKKKYRVNSIYTDALNAMLKADKSRAITLLRNVVKEDSNHIEAYIQLGNIIRDDNPQQALKIHQTLTVRPNLDTHVRLEIFKSLAEDYERIGNFNKAKKEAESILKIDKQNKWAVNFLLKMSEMIEDWDSATEKFLQLQKINNNQDFNQLSKYLVYKGRDEINNGDFHKAELFFNKAIKKTPEFGLPYKYLGDLKMINRDLINAIKLWEKFIELSPGKAHLVFDNMEAALFDLGRYSEVEKFYRRIIEFNKNDLEAGIKLANVLNEKGEENSAIELIDRLINSGNDKISVLLMKLKLSLSIKTPIELAHQIDEILKSIDNNEN